MTHIVFEFGLSNDTIKLGLFPNLALAWTLHLQEKMEVILEGLPEAHHIVTI